MVRTPWIQKTFNLDKLAEVVANNRQEEATMTRNILCTEDKKKMWASIYRETVKMRT